ncbi:MAG: chlorophyll synthesis pathway protein BchC [Proteobacteria bacterium]|nr:chlorophyll synthesis pathway protein BchC [Pseudomonadota bacterium]
MQTSAVILDRPGVLGLRSAELRDLGAGDVLVEVDWSGISTGTERLLWSGRMPPFPGMGYPLVPGYESVGRVIAQGSASSMPLGTHVFVPGANAFREVRSLFGGAARRLVVEERRCVAVAETLGRSAILLALAATAHHVAPIGSPQPELIVGHGALGRLLARLATLSGASPVVWERDERRRAGATGYTVISPDEDQRKDYRLICDVSGSAGIVDQLVAHLAPGGEIVLAGFYAEPVAFDFPPAFMREARLRIAAQWQPADLAAVNSAIAKGQLSLDGLVTATEAADRAPEAYAQAFEDPACLKMCLDWRSIA